MAIYFRRYLEQHKPAGAMLLLVWALCFAGCNRSAPAPMVEDESEIEDDADGSRETSLPDHQQIDITTAEGVTARRVGDRIVWQIGPKNGPTVNPSKAVDEEMLARLDALAEQWAPQLEAAKSELLARQHPIEAMTIPETSTSSARVAMHGFATYVRHVLRTSAKSVDEEFSNDYSQLIDAVADRITLFTGYSNEYLIADFVIPNDPVKQVHSVAAKDSELVSALADRHEPFARWLHHAVAAIALEESGVPASEQPSNYGDRKPNFPDAAANNNGTTNWRDALLAVEDSECHPFLSLVSANIFAASIGTVPEGDLPILNTAIVNSLHAAARDREDHTPERYLGIGLNGIHVRTSLAARLSFVESMSRETAEHGLPNSTFAAAAADLHNKVGWLARGNGMASTVDEQAWPVYIAQMKRAANYSMLALQSDPTNPSHFGRVAGSSKTPETGVSLRYWIAKGLEVERDNALLFHHYNWATQPRWGGSFKELLELMNAQTDVGEFEQYGLSWNAFDTNDTIRKEANCFGLGLQTSLLAIPGYMDALDKLASSVLKSAQESESARNWIRQHESFENLVSWMLQIRRYATVSEFVALDMHSELSPALQKRASFYGPAWASQAAEQCEILDLAFLPFAEPLSPERVKFLSETIEQGRAKLVDEKDDTRRQSATELLRQAEVAVDIARRFFDGEIVELPLDDLGLTIAASDELCSWGRPYGQAFDEGLVITSPGRAPPIRITLRLPINQPIRIATSMISIQPVGLKKSFAPSYGIFVGRAQDHISLVGLSYGQAASAMRRQGQLDLGPEHVGAVSLEGSTPPTELALTVGNPVVTEVSGRVADFPTMDYSAAKEFRPISIGIASAGITDHQVVITKLTIQKVDDQPVDDVAGANTDELAR